MRDLIVFGLVLWSLPLAFRRPFLGVLVFSWLAYMRPQDLCWGFARTMRLSFFVGLTMLVGWFVHEAHTRPFWRRDVRTRAMLALAVLTTISFILGEVKSKYVTTYYIEFVKIIAIAMFTTGQTDSRERLRLLLWTIALSLGFYGVKSGLFGLLTGGGRILRGPGGLLEDNNDFALALVMNVPLLFYLGQAESKLWVRTGMKVAVALTLIAILLTHSRGGFLAAVATLLAMAWRSGKLLQAFGTLALLGACFALFAPRHVIERLSTLQQGGQESSAGARLRAWRIAGRMIEANPVFGVGIRNFQVHWTRHAYGIPGAVGGFAYVAHNSYLQIWAEGGTIAFALFLLLIGSVFVTCRRIRLLARARPDLDWALHYARMFEATTVGFMVGAFFLNRGHFDLVYHWFALVSCTAFVFALELRKEPTTGALRPQGVRIRMRPELAGSLLPRWGR